MAKKAPPVDCIAIPVTETQLRKLLEQTMGGVPVAIAQMQTVDSEENTMTLILGYIEGKKRPYRVVTIVGHPSHEDILTEEKFSSPQLARETYTTKITALHAQFLEGIPNPV